MLKALAVASRSSSDRDDDVGGVYRMTLAATTALAA